MKRREVIGVLLGSAAAWPFAGRAQQPGMPVIGYLSVGSPTVPPTQLAAFHQALGEAGYVEGRNVMIEYRWADGDYDRRPALAADLVRRKVDVIIAAAGIPSALAAKEATSTTAIVFVVGSDPIKSGLVASLNRPGGNMTGATFLSSEMTSKKFELLHELVPATLTTGFLVNSANPNTESDVRDAQTFAAGFLQKLIVMPTRAESEFATAFDELRSQGAGALVIQTDSLFNSKLDQLAALAFRNALPAIYGLLEFAVAGGLMSYGISRSDVLRQMGLYAGRILRGEKPGDLPVQRATKVELIINLRTAKALGITVPPTLLARADELIE
jgi:putative tryptophan/tyrosine transport system substrate-binding protein